MATVLIRPSYGDKFSPCHLNMFVLKNFMSGQGIPVLFMRRKINGDILMKTETIPDRTFFNIKNINNVPVNISLPYKLNYLTGIIHHPELAYLTVEEAMDLLKDQVFRVAHNLGATHCKVSWLITERTELPASVLLGWDRVKVKPLRPRPVRCYHCQSYGHIAVDCKKPSVCGTCSGDHELDYNCQRPAKCPACSGPHTIFDPQCPVWLEETEVAKVKRDEKKSYRDALKIRNEQKKQEHQEEAQEEDESEEEQEQEDETEDSEDSEEEQEEEKQAATNKEQKEDREPRNAQQKRKTTQDEEQEDKNEEPPNKTAQSQADPPKGHQQGQSGSSSSGDWRKVTSRKKKR